MPIKFIKYYKIFFIQIDIYIYNIFIYKYILNRKYQL